MENILGLIGTIIGALGLALAMFVAVIQVKEQKRNAQERAEEKEMHAQELEMQKQEKARSDRLMFLTDRIFDPYIPKEFKLPFYKEYISMKGNGTAVRFWLLEGEREKKAQQST